MTPSATALLVQRPSTDDRERAAAALRRACAEERLSVETLSTRLELVFAARTRIELDRLTADIGEPNALRRTLLAFVMWASRWSHDLTAAWRVPRTPRLILPRRENLVIGRASANDFVVADPTVSHRHAILSYTSGTWTLCDSGSTNGTFVNGWRVTDPIVVRPGDEVLFGTSRFILAPPP